MSSGLMEDIIIKEECSVEDDSNGDLQKPMHDTFDEPRSKCGEVFLGHRRGDFTLVCVQCLQSFSDLSRFGEHIRDEHPLYEIETLLPDVFQHEMRPLKLEPPDDEHGSSIKLHHGEHDIKVPYNPIHDPPCGAGDQFGVASSVPKTGTLRQNDEDREQFCCYSCGMSFVEFESYRRHYKNQHPHMIENDGLSEKTFVPKVPKDIVCKYCLNSFKNLAAYHMHTENVHFDGLYTCPYCPKVFKFNSSRNIHVNNHEGKKPYKCPQCSKAFTAPHSLQDHINIHLNLKRFSCRFCEKTFIVKSNLRRHELIHTKERPFGCNECHLKFRDKRQFDLHMGIHWMNKTNYNCPESDCDKVFISPSYLKSHILTHKIKRPVSSDIKEDIQIKDENVLQDVHEGNFPSPKSDGIEAAPHLHHAKQGEEMIAVAGSASVNDEHCEDGVQSHLDNKQTGTLKQNRETFCCYSCGFIFIKSISYIAHYRSVHPDMIANDASSQESGDQASFVPKVPREMLCKYCLKTFNDPAVFHIHMENGHPNKLYTCPYCPKSFSHKTSRDRHIDAHEGNKQYKCSHCPKAFTTRGSLKVHINIHLNIKRFACRFCDKKFVVKPNLKRHELIHLKEGPFRCRDCSLNFKDKTQLDIHMQQHTQMNN